MCLHRAIEYELAVVNAEIDFNNCSTITISSTIVITIKLSDEASWSFIIFGNGSTSSSSSCSMTSLDQCHLIFSREGLLRI
jgi:hypothetical protein